MNRIFIISMVLVSLVLVSCTSSTAPSTAVSIVKGKQVQVEGGSYTDVSVPELQAMLGDKDFTFINVHIPFEGDIPGTDLSIPFDEISQNLDKLPDKDAKIVLYCRSGRMSDISARELISLGYTNIWNLSGGMVAWEKAGLDSKH